MSEDTQNQEAQTSEAETPKDTDAEMAMLKKRADQLGLKYSPKIGLDKLRDKVNAAVDGTGSNEDEDGEGANEAPMTARDAKIQRRNEMVKDKMRLIRVRVTNMDSSKSDMHGDFYTVSNKILGKVTKFIPFDGEPYHVPKVLLDFIKGKKFLEKKVLNKPNGQIEIKTRFIKEFAIEELEPLTEKELEQLKRAQKAKEGL